LTVIAGSSIPIYGETIDSVASSVRSLDYEVVKLKKTVKENTSTLEDTTKMMQ